MNLDLDPGLGEGYPSASQWARRVTEGWASENLYCLACSADFLEPHAANRAVEDYHCATCSRRVQLKAKNGRIGATVSNSAYESKRAAILAGRAPDYCFMAYHRNDLQVRDLTWVPGHFMTLNVVSKRPPLKATAQRAGWVGSNIHLNRIPDSGKIAVVQDGLVLPKRSVRAAFSRMSFVQHLDVDTRGWLTDVLACLDQVAIRPGSRFTNQDAYGYETHLAKLHPRNRNIRPKIRQQLQVLERNGVVRRVSPGNYERL